MAVHVPLSEEAKAEARILMLGANNILSPKDGKPIVTPSQDMVLGNYYITMEKPGREGEGRIFRNSNEALMAYERREVDLHTRIVVPVNSFKHKVFLDSHKDQYLVTTVGKLIFNEILPDSFPYVNEPSDENIEKYTPNKYFIAPGENINEKIKEIPKASAFKKGTLEKIIAQMFKKYKTTETSIMLDKLKDLGFKYSTYAGITISAFDVISSKSKDQVIADSEAEVKKINKQFQRGLITNKERFDLVIGVWDKAKKDIEKELEGYAKSEEYEDNPIFIMMNSKARGSISNFVQLAGMRGTMAKPNGEPVEIPIKSSFRDGLSVSEFFLSTHGARKGSADTALKTADSGYMTRRLVDVAQDLIVREEDCGTTQGVVVEAFRDDKDGIIEPLYDRILGRYTNKKVIDPNTKEVIIEKNELITENIADKIINAGIEQVEIRTVLTCRTDHGVCCKCYGRNLATGNIVEIGEAVGTMGAQSIGEPGTQLTMRTFHTGGVAGGEDITQGLPRVEELFEARIPKGKATISEIDGVVSKIDDQKGRTKIYVQNDNEVREHLTSYGAKIRVEKGDKVSAGDRLTEGNVSPKELLAVTDPNTVQQYILKEVQKVYRSQGVDINDKHVELIARRMISQIRIMDSGDTNFLPSTVVSINKFTEGNKDVILQGKKPAIGQPILLGITKSSLQTDSFLASASFQETTRILTEAAVKGNVDYLHGLKENVIIGKLIPAGTGAKEYMDIGFSLEKEFFDDEPAEAFEEEFLD